MDEWQRFLFGRTPRSVGTPNQFLVSSESEYRVFLDTAEGNYNLYASLSWFPAWTGFRPVTDRVAYDLDSPRKEAAFTAGLTDGEKIERMRDDPALADRVLGDVCEDARSLARKSREEGVPVVGVFSGFGIHVHQLFRPEDDPEQKIESTARRYADHAGATTLDGVVTGDAERLLRIPNVRRVDDPYPGDPDEQGDPCSLYTVPLTGGELAEITPSELLAWSRGPRHPPTPTDCERPEMQFYDDYYGSNPRMEVPGEQEELEPGIDPDTLTDDGIEWLLKRLVPMPCMYERLLQRNPAHEVRRNAAVMLFNAGLRPKGVADLFARLGWADWNRQVTRKHLDQIYREGYSDMNCDSIRGLGLCVRDDDPHECATYGWSGGRPEWQGEPDERPPHPAETGRQSTEHVASKPTNE